MKKIIVIIIAALCCSLAISEEVTTPASLVFVLNKLNQQSYVVLKLEYEDQGYEAHVITPQGFLQEIKFDHTGNQLLKQSQSVTLSMAAALQLIQKAGYNDITSIKISKNNTYLIGAVRSSDKKEVDITIDAHTGKIDVVREWWDIF